VLTRALAFVLAAALAVVLLLLPCGRSGGRTLTWFELRHG
jgi:hypothetical protein